MSDLIEKLGGYEKALDLFRGCPLDGGTVDVPNLRSKGMLRLELSELSSELLEYRRQHNIYEVGDYFCYESKYLSDDPLDGEEYAKLHQLDSIDFECGWVDEVMKRVCIIRHATDEEIKAGKRLEVSNDSTSSDHT